MIDSEESETFFENHDFSLYHIYMKQRKQIYRQRFLRISWAQLETDWSLIHQGIYVQHQYYTNQHDFLITKCHMNVM